MADKKGGSGIIRIGDIEQAILLIRDQRVILDTDLASFYGVPQSNLSELYGVETRVLKRKRSRFPDDFAFIKSAGFLSELIYYSFSNYSAGSYEL